MTSGSSEASPSKESESSTAGGGPAKSGNGGNGGNGQSNPGKSRDQQALSGAKPLGTSAAETDSGGGSSPLVPILIAVAALAAISVAVAVWQRRKRGGPDARVSPEAS
jgi:hypothetical protein